MYGIQHGDAVLNKNRSCTIVGLEKLGHEHMNIPARLPISLSISVICIIAVLILASVYLCQHLIYALPVGINILGLEVFLFFVAILCMRLIKTHELHLVAPNE